MSRLTRDRAAEPVSRDQIFRRERGQENKHFPLGSADHEQDWQSYPVYPHSAESDDHAYDTYILLCSRLGIDRYGCQSCSWSPEQGN